jgi:cytoskeleton protein RodZ
MRALSAVLQERRSNLAESRMMMSSVDNGFDAAGGEGKSVPMAARVGADLRAARERLTWTLPAVAAHLRIRLPYLEAIEDGRIEELPGNAYAVGFLRAYAQALGLDPDEITRRFRAEAGEVNRKTELSFPVPVPERGMPAGAVVLVGAVLAVLAYVGWYHFSGDQRPTAHIVQQVPDRLAPLIDKAAPVSAPVAEPGAKPAPAAQLATTAPAPGAPAASLPLPSVPPSSAAAAVTAPSAYRPNPGVAAATGGTPAANVPMPSLPPQPVATDASGDGSASRIVLRAKADAWIQVRDRQGKVLLNRVLRNGETWAVPAHPQLLLTTGNAGGIELLVDGVVAAPLGGEGAVRRDLLLDPEAIKEGKLVPLTRGQRS